MSGVSKNRDYLGLLLRLMVSERPEGDEEGRWREPCTRCLLKRAQRWWEKEKKKQYTVVRVSRNEAPMPAYKGTSSEGSKLSNVSQFVMRLPTGGTMDQNFAASQMTELQNCYSVRLR